MFSVAQDVAQDASGNNNIASNILQAFDTTVVQTDTTAPTLVLASNATMQILQLLHMDIVQQIVNLVFQV